MAGVELTVVLSFSGLLDSFVVGVSWLLVGGLIFSFVLVHFIKLLFVVVTAPEVVELIPDHVLQLVVVVGAHRRVQEVQIKIETDVVNGLLRILNNNSTDCLCILTRQEAVNRIVVVFDVGWEADAVDEVAEGILCALTAWAVVLINDTPGVVVVAEGIASVVEERAPLVLFNVVA